MWRRHGATSARRPEPTAAFPLLTGINRKEVRRLTTPVADEWGPESVTSFASAVYAAWSLREEWHDPDGRPRALPKRGEHSFDMLVKA
jgi:hypothetical protein